jgi:uncharacterized protein YggE
METKTNSFGMPQWLAVVIGALLAVFLLLAAVQQVIGISRNSSKQPEKTLPISAEGKVTATPDLATINVGVLSQGATAREVQDASAKQINAITEFAKKQGIDEKDIQTAQNGLYPNQDYRDGKATITGYQANYTSTLKVRGVDRIKNDMGAIISGVTDNGANQINGVYFSIDKPDELQQQAQQLAIENAKKKAKALADSSGLKLGKIISINDNGGGGGYPVPYASDAVGRGGAEKSSVAPSVEPGSQDVIANMSVVFELK